MRSEDSLKNFLSLVPSQREVCLIIVNDDQKLELSQTLRDEGYSLTSNSESLFDAIDHKIKAYFLLEGELPKTIRDIIIQYPTGQVEVFDNKEMKSKVVSPEYGETAIVMVASDEQIRKAEKNGFNILENVGLAYRR